MPETTAPETSAKLVCRSVWKLFGSDADRIARLIARGAVGDDEVAASDAIPAVRDVSLGVNAGECFVIMGLSGSGKSTLVRCMSRLVEPSAGEILFNGENLLAASDKRMIEIRRHHMGMVFQNFALLPHLSVLGNVAFPLEVQGVGRVQREARAREMIELVGLAGREHFFPRELSGGQQQRVGIARSLAVEPELWFLDEPFSALDPLIRREMQDEFMRLQSVLKKTIVFITHDFDEAIRLGDRIAIMKDGIVVQVGTPEEIVLAPANSYVSEFTRNVAKAKVLRVGSLATALPGSVAVNGCAGEVFAAATVSEAAPLFGETGTRLLVKSPQGQPVGTLDRETVAAVMMRG